MSQLELTITAEQVKSFLGGDDFESFLDDSQSPDPTNGKMNYARRTLGLSYRIIEWKKFIPLPEEVKSYFGELLQTIGLFKWSLQAVTYEAYSINKEKELQEHYDSFVQLAALYARGIKLEQQYPNVPELKISNTDIRRQITVANILFNPEKRDIDFRHLMWGPSDRFDEYLDGLNEG